MTETEEFAHGRLYGDYSGVSFFGPPSDGFWLDHLAASNRYMNPLFQSILDRTSGSERAHRLVSDWNELQGWAFAEGPVQIEFADAAEFAEALAQLSSDDVAKHCAGCTPDECLRCAAVIQEFIRSRLAKGLSIFIEDD